MEKTRCDACLVLLTANGEVIRVSVIGIGEAIPTCTWVKRWAGHVARMGEMGDAYKIVVG
jgi:hypothetical protein